MEYFRLLLKHLTWIEYQFLSGIRDSKKAGSLWGMMKGVRGVRKSIHQRWLAKELGLGLGLLCWGSSSARGSVRRGQHSSNRVSGISARTMHQSITPSLSQTIWPIVQTLLLWLLLIPLAQRLSLWNNWEDERGCDEGHWYADTRGLLSGIRDSRKPGSPWGMMRGEGGVRKSIHQRWLAKGLGLGLLCWGFKGVQEEASTFQIGSVAFPPGQFTSSQLHPYDRLFWPNGHPDSSSASL